MRHKVLPIWLALIVILALTVFVAGCGDSTDESSTSASTGPTTVADVSGQELIAQSGEKMATIKSASFVADVALNVDGDATKVTDATQAALLEEGITMHAAGKSATDPVAVDMTMNLSMGDFVLDFGLLAKGDKMWVEYQDKWYKVDQKNSSAVSSQASSGASPTEQMKSLGLDPADWGTTYTVVGTETLDGTEVYHVHATADPEKVAAAVVNAMNDPDLAKKLGDEDAASQLEQALSQTSTDTEQLKKMLKDVSVDYWIGVDDMLTHKMAFAATLDTTGQKDMDGVTAMSISMTATMNDFNEPVTVTAPAKSQSFDKLTEQVLGGMTGF